MTNDNSMLVTTREAAVMLKVSVGTIYNLRRNNVLTPHYIQGCLRFSRAEVMMLASPRDEVTK